MKFKSIKISFRQRIIFGFSILLLLFLFLMITFELVGIPGTEYKGSFDRYRSSVLNDMDIVSGLLSQQISSWFKERRNNVQVLSRSPFLRKSIRIKNVEAKNGLSLELKTFLASHTEFESAALLDPENASIFASAGNFKEAKTSTDIFINQTQFSKITIPGYIETIDICSMADMKDRIRIFRQVTSLENQNLLIAILVVDINNNSSLFPHLWSIINPLSRNWEGILASNVGGVTTELSEYSGDGKSRQSTFTNIDAFPPLRLAISGIEGPYDGPDEKGQSVLAFHRQIKIDRGITFALVLKMDRNLALQPAWSFLIRQILIWFFIFIFGIGISLFIARQISKPIQDLVTVAGKIESGDLTARASINPEPETGLLATVFNSMVTRLQNWQQDLEKQVFDRTRELKDSELKWQFAIEGAGDGLLDWNIKSNKVIYSQQWKLILGYSNEEITNNFEEWRKRIYPEDLENCMAEIERHFNKETAVYQNEHRLLCKDGKYKWVLARGKIIEWDKGGNPLRFIGTHSDISQRKLAEDALKESETRFKKIFDDSFDPVLLIKENRFVGINKATVSILKYEQKEDLIGKAPWDISSEFQPDGRSSKEKALDLISKSFFVATNPFEWVHLKKDGSELYVEIMLTPVILQNEVLIHATWHDLTRRKLAESALVTSEKKFREMADFLPVTIFEANLKGEINFVNKISLEIFGYTTADIDDGINIFMFILPEDHEKASLNMTNVLKGLDTAGSEYMGLKKDGTRFPVFIKSSCIKVNGQTVGLRGIVMDITERKMTEEALRQSEMRFRELFDEAPVGYHEIDKEGRIIKINHTELKMLQYEENEMINQYIWNFVIEKDLCEEGLTNKLNGREQTNKSYELTFRRKDGSTFAGLLEDVLLKTKDYQITGIRSTVQDISIQKLDEIALHESNIQLERTLTELRETQKMVLQQERMRSLGQMASGIAHDINNSLSPVIGYADLLLRDKNLDEKIRKRITFIRTAGLDIVKTIERMKEFYRPRIEQDEFSHSDLNAIISSTIDLTRHKWKDMAEQQGKVIRIENISDEDLPLILGHESEIREALTNLIINASDAMPDGGKIAIKSYTEIDSIIIEIADEGNGMDEETLNHCMDPFFTTKGDKGTGLGLSMVYGIMQRHQGKIQIESTKGKGTKIKLYFLKHLLNTENIEKNEQAALSHLKILCIDDNENMRDMLVSMLQEKEHTVNFASSGKTGLEIFFQELSKKTPFDLVITDLGMPYMDGKSVAESIKSESPETPIILMTGWGAFIDQTSIKSVDYILKKPITFEELNKAIRSVLKL